MAHDDLEKVVRSDRTRLILIASVAIVLFVVALIVNRPLAGEIVKAGFTGIVFAAVAYCFSWYRNWDVENTLRKALTPNGISNCLVEGNLRAFGVTITNNTRYTVVVRDVEFFTENTRMTLSPNLLGKYPHVIQPNHMTDKTTTCTVSNQAIQEFLQLPPYTEATWGLIIDKGSMFLDREIHGCSVLFEYPRVFGDVTLVRVRSSESVSQMMRTCWNGVRASLRDSVAEAPRVVES